MKKKNKKGKCLIPNCYQRPTHIIMRYVEKGFWRDIHRTWGFCEEHGDKYLYTIQTLLIADIPGMFLEVLKSSCLDENGYINHQNDDNYKSICSFLTKIGRLEQIDHQLFKIITKEELPIEEES